jgi:hypothetical protein
MDLSEEEDAIDLSGESGIQEVVDDVDPTKPKHQIKAIGEAEGQAQKRWTRLPAATARGACHTKTFIAKLRVDAIELMDDQINQWLEDNPDYEVKFISSSTGDLMGKVKEPTLFLSVWV